jgi:hypothetical protein
MFKVLLFAGAIVFASSAAFAGDIAQDNQFRTLTIQGGQGPAVTVVIPAQPLEAPYALTGSQSAPQLDWAPMQLGQGVNPVWVTR